MRKCIAREKYINRPTLKRKYGLTDSLIRRLGDPDTEVTRSRWHPAEHMFLVDRVERFVAEIGDELEALRQKRARAEIPKHCDLLDAIFAVNRAAKRHRDLAASSYERGHHRRAGRSRRHKERLYQLKDRGIAQALRLGMITPQRVHGGLCLYVGEGYSFHCTLVPAGMELPKPDHDGPITVEANSQGRKEPRQRDAIATLEALPEVDETQFDRLEVPRVERNHTSDALTCWGCGEPGHLRRDCPYEEAWEGEHGRSVI